MLSPYIDRGQVEYHYQEINLREPNNKNFLNQKASGDYNIFLADDDMLFPKSLSIIKNYIEKFPNNDLYGFGYTYIDENDNISFTKKAPKKLEINLEKLALVKMLFCCGVVPYGFFIPTFCWKNGIKINLATMLVSEKIHTFYLISLIQVGKYL